MTDVAHRIEAFQDKGGRWRFHVIAGNGKVVAASGESFASKSNAQRAVEDLLVGMYELVERHRAELAGEDGVLVEAEAAVPV